MLLTLETPLQFVKGIGPRIAQTLLDKRITTIEGLSPDGNHPVQRAWVEEDVPQCGYCQSGQIMSAASLLSKKAQPTDADIDEAMRGNICRCGTYQSIRKAVHLSAQYQAESKQGAKQ